MSSKQNWCIDKKCHVILSPIDILIDSEIVTELILNIEGDFEAGNVIEIRDHLAGKPWRVLSKYIFPNIANKTITIPLISKRLCRVMSGDTICHLQLTPITTVLENICKGNNKYTFLLYFSRIFLYFLFFFSDEADTFYSDTEEEYIEDEDETW